MNLRPAAAVMALALVLGLPRPAAATDPERGRRLFQTAPAAGELACADCHSDDPVNNNFGNIWSGRNAVALIQRAVGLNTGGMGVFSSYYGDAELADIAAYLGNAPTRLDFRATQAGERSPPQQLVISASSKAGIGALALQVQGEFTLVSPPCPAQLPPLGSCTLSLVFTPQPAGPGAGTLRTGTLLITHDGLPTPVAVPLAGIGRDEPPAVVTLVPAALDFGRVAAGGAGAERLLRVANGSPQPLTLHAITLGASAFGIVGGDCHAGRRLPTGQACVLALRFDPAGAGDHAAQLQLAHDGQGGASTVPLAGTAVAMPAAHAQVHPAALRLDAPARRGSVLLHNSGNAPLRLRAIEVSPAAPVMIDNPGSGDCVAGEVLPARAACRIGIGVDSGSSAAGAAFVGELRIHHDAAPQPLRVVLDGSGAAQPAAAAATTPLWVDRPVLRLDEGTPQRLAVANRGSTPLQLDRLELVGSAAGQVLTGGACGAGSTLAPGAGCELLLQAAPTLARPLRASLRLQAGAIAALVSLQAPPATLPLPPVPEPQLAPAAGRLALVPPRLDFQAEPGASGGRQRVWIQNAGAGLLLLRSLTRQGEGYTLAAADDATGEPCALDGMTLLPGRGCAVDVAWSGAAARFGGSLLVELDGGADTVRVPLTVTESAAGRRNQGGGGALGVASLLGLAALAWWLRRARPESPR